MADTTILLAGATGMLGGKIARALLAKSDVELRLLVRGAEAGDPKRRPGIDAVADAGALIVEADLANPRALKAATHGVDVVVSAVNGDRDIIVDGQTNLLEAARASGVRRFIPSDFAIDIYKLEDGENYNLDLRRAFAGRLDASGLERVHVLIGCFTEVLFGPYLGIFDLQAGTCSYWGDGETRFDTTTTDDTALYVAEAALDPNASGKFAVAGDQLSMKEAIAAYERATGKALAARTLGSVAELERRIADLRARDPNPQTYLSLQYQHGMVSGRGKLADHVNARYPDIRPLDVAGYCRAAFAAAAGAPSA
jgi:nucleoside-diphosphate-sugar epimerase